MTLPSARHGGVVLLWCELRHEFLCLTACEKPQVLKLLSAPLERMGSVVLAAVSDKPENPR